MACSAILGLDPKPIDDGAGTTGHDGGGREGSSPDGPLGSDGGPVLDRDGNVIDGSPGVDAADGNDGKIDCLGARRNAFYCDGFEGATIGAPWTKLLQPGTPPSEVAISTSKHVAGAQSMISAFDTLPASGTAKLRYARPGGAGALSIQFSVYVDSDAWGAGDDMPLGGLRAAGAAAAVVYFVPSGSGSAGQIELRVAGRMPISLGAATINGFACYEVGYDGATVSAYAGATLKGTAALAMAVDAADVGLEWSHGANAGAGKNMEFDDVVIAPAPVGCLH